MRQIRPKSPLAIIPLLVASLTASHASAQVIWDGPSIQFSKSAGADPTQEANQDRITDSVWITRGGTAGIYNAFSELGYVVNSSPAGTEWAYGTTGDLQSLTFQPWQLTIGSNPPSSVGRDMGLHLIAEDAYLDIRFDTWGQGSAAGGFFSYTRSTNPAPEPTALFLLSVSAGAVGIRRRR
ncbi:MAG: PEP-CTERM sorting domain-containing protein [Planctomycetales bacterium]|nr:PEP-CTERM sorting domain-containing protein [Planctomycetales bacterium]